MKPSQRLSRYTQVRLEAEAARELERELEREAAERAKPLEPLKPADAAAMATFVGVLFIPIMTLILVGGTSWLMALIFSATVYALSALYFVVRCWLYWR